MEALMKSDAGAKLVRATNTPGLTANILNTTVGAGFSFSRHSWRLLLGRPSGLGARRGLLWLRSPSPNRSRSQQQHDDVEGQEDCRKPLEVAHAADISRINLTW